MGEGAQPLRGGGSFAEMADFWMRFVAGMLDRILPHAVPDTFFISEDMAYKAKSMISMDMARRFCMQRIAPVVRDGGYIPGCDHGVPSDIAWPDFMDYCQQLARLTGWL